MKPIVFLAAKSSLTMAPDAGSMILPDLPFRGSHARSKSGNLLAVPPIDSIDSLEDS